MNETDFFLENLSMLLGSGMGVLAALDSISGEVKSSSMKKKIKILRADIQDGMPLWKSLSKLKIVQAHVISLIKVGEESGRLPENLKTVAAQTQKERDFKSKVRSAMMYPTLVFFLIIVIAVGIAWFILPKLANVFNNLDMTLPAITRYMIAAGDYLSAKGSTVIPIFLGVLFVLLYFIFVFSKTKIIGQFLLFNTPWINGLIRESELARFGFILGTLLNAGLPIVEAIRSLEDATTSPFYKNLYKFLGESIAKGSTFGKVFTSFKGSGKLVPKPIQGMIIASEQSGNLPDTLIKIGQIYENKAEITTKNLAVLMEPILLIIVWAGVVMVALAVILPIYSLVGGLNG